MTYAVRFEGTLSDTTPRAAFNLDMGKPNLAVIEALRKLEGDIIIVSTAAQTMRGHQLLTSWLRDNNMPPADVWTSFTLPEFDIMVDNAAIKLI